MATVTAMARTELFKGSTRLPDDFFKCKICGFSPVKFTRGMKEQDNKKNLTNEYSGCIIIT